MPDAVQLLGIRTQEFDRVVVGLVDPEAKEHIPGHNATKLKKTRFSPLPSSSQAAQLAPCRLSVGIAEDEFLFKWDRR